MKSTGLKRRAQELAAQTNSETIPPTEVGGIMYDTVEYIEDVERNGASLGIRKTYTTVSAMEADNNPTDSEGNPLKKGMLVNIYNQEDPSASDNGKVFSWQNPGWQLRTKMDAGYATRGELTELDIITNKNVYTQDVKANSLIRFLFLDPSGYTGGKSLEGLKVAIISRGLSNLWGLTMRNKNEELIVSEWKDSEVNYINKVTLENIKLYVVFDWGVLKVGTNYVSNDALLLPLAFNNGNSPFVSEEKLENESVTNTKIKNNSITTEKIKDESVSSEKLEGTLTSSIYKQLFVNNKVVNKAFQKLFIDTSGYTGDKSLEGLNIKILAKNVRGQYGIQLGNSKKETIESFFEPKEIVEQSITKSGIYVYALYNWDNIPDGNSIPGAPYGLADIVFNPSNDPRSSISTEKIQNKSVTQEKLAFDLPTPGCDTTLTGLLYGQAGDSISEGAGLDSTLDESDPYNPISGTKKATYGYYIAKLNHMRWANYGISGSTLGYVVANGIDRNGFSKEKGRYTQMDDDLTHISIFFGWNDDAYGRVMKREEWLQKQYSKKIYYPRTPDLIGTSADDGTPFTTQEQYEAVNSVTGNVGGVDYDNADEYFNAIYIGTSDDTTNKTFWGAWNIVLPYLIKKYPVAKILVIVPFGCSNIMRKCIRDAAHKYGLITYDFSKPENQLFRQWEDDPATGRINGTSIKKFRMDSLTSDGLHPNENGYKYMYPSINAKLISL